MCSSDLPAPETAAAVEVEAPKPLTLDDALNVVFAELKSDGETLFARLEREMIARMLADENGDEVKASKRLGLTRPTLQKKAKEA